MPILQKLGSTVETTNKYLLTPAIFLLTAAVSVYTAITKNQMDKQNAIITEETAKIQNAAKSIESELAEKEFENNLKFQMYTEVKEAISDTNSKKQKVVLSLVNEMLADDSTFREKLITILLASSQVNVSVKEEQNRIELRKERFESGFQDSFPVFTIDILYSDDLAKKVSVKAESVSKLLQEKYPSYNIRLRCLPREINARKAFRFGRNEIRYNKTDSTLDYAIQKELLAANLITEDTVKLKEGIGPRNSEGPKNYMTLFIKTVSQN